MKRVLFLFAFLSSSLVFGQAPLDVVENKIPDNWSAGGGKLSLSTKHFKAGKQSVRWDWKSSKRSLKIVDTAFQSVAANPRSTFVVWIYNESPINDKLVFQFGKDGKVNSSFNFNLNFKGWRTAWVMYHRDMQGTPLAGMNTLQIKAPTSIKKGSLYFDQVLYNVAINPRSPMRDEQVPFVNPDSDKAANSHWNALYTFSRTPHSLSLPASVSESHVKDLGVITKRFEQILLPAPSKLVDLAPLEKSFAYWEIKRNGDLITGRPVYSTNDIELVSIKAGKAEREWNQQFGIKRYSELMLDLAFAYRNSKDEAIKKRTAEMFIDLVDHMENQGWTSGSGMGALHHLGYNLRDYYSACLLMKPVLKSAGKLERTWESMYWFSGLGRTQQALGELPLANIDVFNTLLPGMLSTVLIMDDSPEKIRQMQEFSNYLSHGMKPDYALGGTFKPDGAVFHHGTLYPAYAVGGFQGLTPIVYSLSRTSFRVSEDAHFSLKKAMLMMHYYTNPVKWPLSVSGRHPTGPWGIPDTPYGYLALAGTPDGRQSIDKEIGAVYLKITEHEKKAQWRKKFSDLGIKPAAYPNGHWNLNFGLFDIHRRQDWLLTVRGHNRYITSHEAYPGANMYGRYLAYGHLEVLFPQTPNNSGSNFKDEGWDWNNIPGTTTLHLPLEKLRARIINADDFSGIEEMLISDEVFAGGTKLNDQGMFSMKLSGHDKYDMGSFKANKSWFMFDSLVIAVGSDIKNNIKDYATQTTLFQNVLEDKNSAFFVNNKKIDAFPFQQKWNAAKDLSLIDNRGIGYYLPNQKDVFLSKSVQTSRDQKDTKDTKGEVSKLIIDHGFAPKGQRYEYAMLIKTDQKAMQNFSSAMKSRKPVYRVLQNDSLAHSLWYAPLNITASALFKSSSSLKDSLLLSNDKPVLVMYQKNEDGISMSVTDPDLAFYSGPDDSPRTPDGKRIEVSIYSRSWYKAPAQPSVVKLKIKGIWDVVPSNTKVKASVEPDGNTVLTIPCGYGLASELKLINKNAK